MRISDRTERDAKVVRLALSGSSYREVARAVGLRSASSVGAILKRHLGGDDAARRQLLAAEAGAMFIERSEALLSAHWPAAMEGDYKAAVMCLRVLDEQAKFYGLYERARAARR